MGFLVAKTCILLLQEDAIHQINTLIESLSTIQTLGQTDAVPSVKSYHLHPQNILASFQTTNMWRLAPLTQTAGLHTLIFQRMDSLDSHRYCAKPSEHTRALPFVRIQAVSRPQFQDPSKAPGSLPLAVSSYPLVLCVQTTNAYLWM